MSSGAEILWECLLHEGVEVFFGYPGAAILPAFDVLPKYPLRHVLCRHEQGAAHMADGYARASGRPGVAVATSGPGATNLVTGIATAMRDSIPSVFITGQVSSSLLGSDAFQEVDIVGITRPITKLSTQIRNVQELASTLHRAFHIARTARGGPVLVDICRDALTAELQGDAAATDVETEAAPHIDEVAIERALAMLARSQHPVILAGHGVVASGAAGALRRLAEIIDAPVAMTLLGLGALPSRHPLALGLMGMHGHAPTNLAIQRADLLVSCGMRFDDRVTGRTSAYALGARRIHIDIDPREIGRNVPVDLGLVGDLGEILARMLDRIPRARRPDWHRRIAAWRNEVGGRDILGRDRSERLQPQRVIHALGERVTRGATIVTDVGQHQMWVAQYFPFDAPRQLITSGGLGTMGFGLPAAIGAKIASPEKETWLIVGDGGFQMTQAELSTIAQEQLDIRIAVINNGHLGMVRQWQELFCERRYVATPLRSPDLLALAAAHGIHAERAADHETACEAIDRARGVVGPALIEFVVEPEALVYPMIPAGEPLDAMLRRPLDRPASGASDAVVARARSIS